LVFILAIRTVFLFLLPLGFSIARGRAAPDPRKRPLLVIVAIHMVIGQPPRQLGSLLPHPVPHGFIQYEVRIRVETTGGNTQSLQLFVPSVVLPVVIKERRIVSRREICAIVGQSR
jgi:hypothetical protein